MPDSVPQHEQKPTNTATPGAQSNAGGGAGGTGGQTAALKGMSFAEGEAAMAPAENGGGQVGGLDTSSFERWVQSALNGVAGTFSVPCGGVEVNGSLRGPTRTAVKGFQKHAKKLPGGKRLGVDGIVGTQTTAALEGVTATTAPSVSEKQRQQADKPAAGGGGAGGGGVGGAGGGGAGAGGDGGAQLEPMEPNAVEGGDKQAADGKGGKPVEDAQKTDVKQSEGDKTPVKPGEKRSGTAGQADELRQRFPKGFLVSLSIPAAFDSVDDAYNEAKENGYKHVDGYAYKVHFPKWAPANSGTVQNVWKTLRGEMGKKGEKLPESYSAADSKAKGKIHSAIMGSSYWDAVRRTMYGDDTALKALAKIAYGNNKHIPNSAASYAKEQRAVAADGGAVAFGKSMIYNKKGEIASLVTGTAAAVGQVLDQNPPADGAKEGQATQDAAAAKARFVTISAHGSSKWMGGHGKASAANLTSKDVPAIVGGMASALAPDVRVRLFACHTSKGKNDSTKGEGTIADVFREELNKAGKTEGAVIGHRESGETQTNSTTRFFSAGGADGAADWGAKDVFTTEYLQGFLAARGLTGSDNYKAVKKAASAYFGREGWMEELKSLEALQKSVRARWEAEYPDAAAVAADIKGVKAPKTKK